MTSIRSMRAREVQRIADDAARERREAERYERSHDGDVHDVAPAEAMGSEVSFAQRMREEYDTPLGSDDL